MALIEPAAGPCRYRLRRPESNQTPAARLLLFDQEGCPADGLPLPPSHSLPPRAFFSPPPLLNLPSTRGEPIPVGQGGAGEPDYVAVPYGCSQTLHFQRRDRKLKPPRKPSTCGVKAVRFIKLELSLVPLCAAEAAQWNEIQHGVQEIRVDKNRMKISFFEDFLRTRRCSFASHFPLECTFRKRYYACMQKGGRWSQTRNARFKSDIFRQFS